MEAVIHLVGIISEAGRSTFENLHTQGTRNLVSASRAAGLHRFVHMSALGARPEAISRYHQTKWAAEEDLRQSGLEFTIIRPSLIYGPGDHFVNLFARIIRCSPLVPLLGSRQARFQPVALSAVAKAFTASLARPESIGKIYDLCGPEPLTLAEMIDQILEVMRRRRLKVRVPGALARGQAALLEWVFPRLLRMPPPLNRDQLLMLEENNLGNPEPANALFNLAHTSFREGIAAYLLRRRTTSANWQTPDGEVTSPRG
jgi:NADH dehydrogenase